MKAVLVVGARPNFMKIAPLLRAIDRHNSEGGGQPRIDPLLVHTGQHYDFQMSQVFFQDLDLPEPDIYLGVGPGTHAEQTAKVMIEFERVLLEQRPDLVVVVGDVNSTLAAALAAVKLHIPVAHVEAGLRSGDRTMPEEINRLLTDQVADYLFTPSPDADQNLKREGVAPEKIFFVGNVMIDSLLYNRPLAEKSDILERLGLLSAGAQERGEATKPGERPSVAPYALLTLHRPGNVDDKGSLTGIMDAITTIAESIPVVFPAHPRTQNKLEEFGLLVQSPVTAKPNGHGKPNQVKEQPAPVIARSADEIGTTKQSQLQSGILIIPALSYLDFLKLEMYARLVMTDSGGIQEETTVLDVPCLTLRETTERPITISHGTNSLVGIDPRRIVEEACRILAAPSDVATSPDEIGTTKQSQPQPPIELWDGRTAERIVDVLANKIPRE